VLRHSALLIQPVADSQGFGVLASSARFTHLVALGSALPQDEPHRTPSLILCHLSDSLDPTGRLAALLDSSRLFSERDAFDVRDSRSGRGMQAADGGAETEQRNWSTVKGATAASESAASVSGASGLATPPQRTSDNIVRRASMASLDILFDDDQDDEQGHDDPDRTDDEEDGGVSPRVRETGLSQERLVHSSRQGENRSCNCSSEAHTVEVGCARAG
jgi:hypothetical protein